MNRSNQSGEFFAGHSIGGFLKSIVDHTFSSKRKLSQVLKLRRFVRQGLTFIMTAALAIQVMSPSLVSAKVDEGTTASNCDASVNLIQNGSFEDPTVINPANWDIYDGDGVAVPSWQAEWMSNDHDKGMPDVAKIELQKTPLNDWSAQAGQQWTELDTDYHHPNEGSGEDKASIKLYQDIAGLTSGREYTLSFYTAPRPSYGTQDNHIQVKWDGSSVGEDGTIQEDGTGNTTLVWTLHTYTVTASGTTARLEFLDHGTPNSFGMMLDDVSLFAICPPPVPQGATIVASKIICNSEADLPNWGEGGHGQITATTAQNFVTASEGKCSFSKVGWQFEWAPEGTSNPGDAITGPAGGTWKTSDPTVDGVTTIALTADDIANHSYVWFREVLQAGYVPFSGWLSNGSNTPTAKDKFSAEIYATTDTLNYDNYDRVEGIQAGGTYYAVAFNVLNQPDDCNFGDQAGWYGQYYNYTATHPDMNLPQNKWPDKTHGNPMGSNWTANWYDNDYFVSVKVDPNLKFGENFFPLDSLGTDDPTGASSHNYHFGVHWSAKATVTADGDYGFALKSDDDTWVYLDGVLVKDNSGIHQPTENDGSMHMTTGTHTVDIFFAERHTVQSHMYFDFTGRVRPELVPYNSACPVPAPTLSLEKTGVYNADNNQIDYALNWQINGGGTLYHAMILDQLPTGSSFVSADNGGVPAGGGTVRWDLGTKLAGDSGTVHLIVSIDSSEPWADSYSGFVQGTRQDGSPVIAERSHPDKALGVAENNDTVNFVSLGFGGSLILQFNNYILNGIGPDISVTETSYGSPSDSSYPEKVEVFASQDGITWVTLGSGIQDKTFDLTTGGLSWAKYLKLVDVSDKTKFSADADGYDIDGVQALHSAPAECSITNTATLSGDTLDNDLMIQIVNPDNTHLTQTAETTTSINELACQVPPEPNHHTIISGMKFNDHNGDHEKASTDEGLAGWLIYAGQLFQSLTVDSHGDVSGTIKTTDPLVNGTKYFIRATGTFDAGDSITADAKYSHRLPSMTWTDLVQTYESYGTSLLNLLIDTAEVNWGSYTPTHTYWYTVTGTGAPLSLQIRDIFASNNVGALNVDIYKVIGEATTDDSGHYSIDLTDVTGDVVVAEQTKDGWVQTWPNPDGFYTVTGTGEFGGKNFGNYQVPVQQEQPKLGSITGKKIHDHDGDGIKDENDETLADWKIYIDTDHDSNWDEDEPFVITPADGSFSFTDLAAGTYIVREVGQSGWSQAWPVGGIPYSLTINADHWNWTNINFGNITNLESQGSTGGGSGSNGGGGGGGTYTPPTGSNEAVRGEQSIGSGNDNGSTVLGNNEAVGGEQSLPVTGSSPWITPLMLAIALLGIVGYRKFQPTK